MILVSLFLYGFTATHAFVVRNDVVRDDDAAAVSSVVRMRDPRAPPNRRPENTSGKIATVPRARDLCPLFSRDRGLINSQVVKIAKIVKSIQMCHFRVQAARSRLYRKEI